MLRCAFALILILAAPQPVLPAAEFRDIPRDHWAADSVKTLAESGILRGYPDGTYKGDRPVTRYELAVALDGMIRFMQASFQPIKTAECRPNEDWAGESMANLRAGGFLPADSPVLQKPDKPITADELAQALASVAAKLIEMRVPEGDQREEPTPQPRDSNQAPADIH